VYLIGSAVICQGFCLGLLAKRDFVWVVLWGVSRGFDWVYNISQEFSLGSGSKTDLICIVSWGLFWAFDRVCCSLPGFLFGVPYGQQLSLGCFEGCF
jgi:hypothetical protein